MEPVKCPNCGNDRFEMHIYHTLNLHTEALKQWAKGGSDPMEYITLGVKAPQTVYSCSNCGYTIGSLADLNILEIAVYIVGNSVSKRRQGLNYIASIVHGKFSAYYDDFMVILKDIGYVQYSGCWIFTKAAWQKAQQDPNFKLSDLQYTVKVKDLT